jgi:hypothetical protein
MQVNDSAFFEDGTTRGKLRNPEFRYQEIDYSGLRIGKCTPSDIDFMMEFNNKLFIAGELKYGTAQMQYGQETLLTRMADGHKIPFFILLVHHTTPATEAIDAGNCKVSMYYSNQTHKWITPNNQTVKELINDLYVKFVDTEREVKKSIYEKYCQ